MLLFFSFYQVLALNKSILGHIFVHFNWAILKYLASVESVRVQFEVNQLPKYYTPFNEDIYISGSFNNWSPNSTRLIRINKDLYQIDLDLSVGTHQFKFNRGSWSNGECNSDGSFMANRQIQVTSTTTKHTSKIANWDDVKVFCFSQIFFLNSIFYKTFILQQNLYFIS